MGRSIPTSYGTQPLETQECNNVILKDEGPIRWLHDQDVSKLEGLLTLVRRHSYLHYIVLRYLRPQMIKYDYHAAIKSQNWLVRLFREIMLGIRQRISGLILRVDRVLHNPEYKLLGI